jgi:hypothetical protein
MSCETKQRQCIRIVEVLCKLETLLLPYLPFGAEVDIVWSSTFTLPYAIVRYTGKPLFLPLRDVSSLSLALVIGVG